MNLTHIAFTPPPIATNAIKISFSIHLHLLFAAYNIYSQVVMLYMQLYILLGTAPPVAVLCRLISWPADLWLCDFIMVYAGCFSCELCVVSFNPLLLDYTELHHTWCKYMWAGCCIKFVHATILCPVVQQHISTAVHPEQWTIHQFTSQEVSFSFTTFNLHMISCYLLICFIFHTLRPHTPTWFLCSCLWVTQFPSYYLI